MLIGAQLKTQRDFQSSLPRPFSFLQNSALGLTNSQFYLLNLLKLQDFYWFPSPYATTWKPVICKMRLQDCTPYPHLFTTAVKHHLMSNDVNTTISHNLSGFFFFQLFQERYSRHNSKIAFIRFQGSEIHMNFFSYAIKH